MTRRKPTWYWLGPACGAIAIWVRLLLFGEPFGHGGFAIVECRYLEAHALPYYWAVIALGALVLIVFGRKKEALVAWVIYLLLFLIGYSWIQPVFYA